MIELPNNLLELDELKESYENAIEFGLKSIKEGYVEPNHKLRINGIRKTLRLIKAKIRYLRIQNREDKNNEKH